MKNIVLHVIFLVLNYHTIAVPLAGKLFSPDIHQESIAEYERLIKYYRYYKQDSAVYFAERALEFAKRTGDKNGEALILIQMGMIDDNNGEFEESAKKYNRSLELFNSINSKTGLVTANVRIGVVELRNGKYDNAIKYFLDALKIAEESGNTFGLMEANYSISWAYLDQDKYEPALKYLKIAETLNEDLPFSSLSLNIFNHFGRIYRNTGEFQKARQYLEKGVSLSDKPEYQGLNITLINNLASVYSEEGHTEKAIALQKEALSRSRKLGNYLRELQALYGLARTYGNKYPNEAISCMKEAIALAREKSAHKQEMRYLKFITELYESQGNYKEAFFMKEREHTLADSFFYKSMSQNISSLKAEYELSKSNARIKELDLLNQQRQFERNVTFAGAGVLLLILALLYNQYRIKQRNSKKISQKNHALEVLLNEKEWLLKEIHHRVKNNLQTVVSLLESQSAYLHDDALLAIQGSQNRVYAMSLIHQKLYQTESVTAIQMTSYLPELISYLSDSFDVRRQIYFDLNIEPIELDVSQAVPMGLILNEAITNAIKYAFPFRLHHNRKEITISITQSSNRKVELVIADNGVGLPAEFDTLRSSNLGLRLMKGLTEDLGGDFVIETKKGTHITVRFVANALLHEGGRSIHLEPVLQRA